MKNSQFRRAPGEKQIRKLSCILCFVFGLEKFQNETSGPVLKRKVMRKQLSVRGRQTKQRQGSRISGQLTRWKIISVEEPQAKTDKKMEVFLCLAYKRFPKRNILQSSEEKSIEKAAVSQRVIVKKRQGSEISGQRTR